MYDYGTYEDGWAIGFNEGRERGYSEGYEDSSRDYEERLAAMWVELQTLNARISYLESFVLPKGEQQ